MPGHLLAADDAWLGPIASPDADLEIETADSNGIQIEFWKLFSRSGCVWAFSVGAVREPYFSALAAIEALQAPRNCYIARRAVVVCVGLMGSVLHLLVQSGVACRVAVLPIYLHQAGIAIFLRPRDSLSGPRSLRLLQGSQTLDFGWSYPTVDLCREIKDDCGQPLCSVGNRDCPNNWFLLTDNSWIESLLPLESATYYLFLHVAYHCPMYQNEPQTNPFPSW